LKPSPAAFGALDARGRLHLVLDGLRAPLTVRLDGAALRIVRRDAADALAPLRRIDRVTARGPVTWEGAALAALGEVGAPLGLIGGEGRLLAVLVGCRAPVRRSLSDALEKAARRRDFAARLEDWRRAQISRLARRFGAADPSADARLGWPAAEAACAAASGLPRPAARRLGRLARGFCELLARRALADAGCPPEWAGAGAGTDLGRPFAQIAAWRLAIMTTARPAGARLRAALAADARAGRDGTSLAAVAELARPRLRRDLACDAERLRGFLLDLAYGVAPDPKGYVPWAG
jgi:hypothetical protein